jgi:hypothetical protein
MIFCAKGLEPLGDKCVKAPPSLLDPNDPTRCRKGIHDLPNIGCVKNHLTRHERFTLCCRMALTDGQDEENFVGTGPHSKEFIAGYNSGVNTGKCPGITGDVANVSANGA